MVKGWKRVLGLGVLAGAGYAAWRALDRSRTDTGLTWQPRPFPYPPEPVPAPGATPSTVESPVDARTEGDEPPAWVEAIDGQCPATHPVKAKLSSGIFHEPGGASYERTRADRCYLSPAVAEAEGLRPSKR